MQASPRKDAEADALLRTPQNENKSKDLERLYPPSARDIIESLTDRIYDTVFASHTNFDVCKRNTQRTSVLLNTSDKISMDLLRSTAIADAIGYEILSIEEIEKLKNDIAIFSNRIKTMCQRLALESKVRDAALSLSRLHARGSKRLSKQAEQELAVSERKINEMSSDLWRLMLRAFDARNRFHRHTSAILTSSQMNIKPEQLRSAADIEVQAKGVTEVGHETDELRVPFSLIEPLWKKLMPNEDHDTRLDPEQVDLRALFLTVGSLLDKQKPLSVYNRRNTSQDEGHQHSQEVSLDQEEMSTDFARKLVHRTDELQNVRNLMDVRIATVMKEKEAIASDFRSLEERYVSAQQRMQSLENDYAKRISILELEMVLEREKTQKAEKDWEERESEQLMQFQKQRDSLESSRNEVESILRQVEELRGLVNEYELKHRQKSDERDELVRQLQDQHGKGEEYIAQIAGLEADIVRLNHECATYKAPTDRLIREEHANDACSARKSQQAINGVASNAVDYAVSSTRGKPIISTAEGLYCELLEKCRKVIRSALSQEKEFVRLEANLDSMTDRFIAMDTEVADERIRTLGVHRRRTFTDASGGSSGEENTTAATLRLEFRKIVQKMRGEQLKALKAEQAHRKRIEAQLRALQMDDLRAWEFERHEL